MYTVSLTSSLCKLYGLRPSIGRFSYRGLSDTFVGQEAVRSNAGPMGQSPQDLELLMSSYMASKPWDADPDVIALPWRTIEEVMPEGPLCFAISWGDELVRLSVPPWACPLRLIGHTSPSDPTGPASRCGSPSKGRPHCGRLAGTARRQNRRRAHDWLLDGGRGRRWSVPFQMALSHT